MNGKKFLLFEVVLLIMTVNLFAAKTLLVKTEHYCGGAKFYAESKNKIPNQNEWLTTILQFRYSDPIGTNYGEEADKVVSVADFSKLMKNSDFQSWLGPDIYSQAQKFLDRKIQIDTHPEQFNEGSDDVLRNLGDQIVDDLLKKFSVSRDYWGKPNRSCE